MKIEDSVAIVTGASSGIGEATARELTARGAKVVLAARRTERLDKLAVQLPNALAVTTDVTQPDQITALVDATLTRFGRVDIVINNAGQGLHLPLADVDPDDFRAIFELNVVAQLSLMQAVYPTMTTQHSGTIINVGSATSRLPLPGLGAYSGTKAALALMSSVARVEWEGDGITVGCILPFLTDTEFHSTLRAGEMVRREGMRPADSPEKVATAIADMIVSGEAEVVLAPVGRREPVANPAH